MHSEKFLTIGEVSAKIGKTHATIYNWIKAGKFPNGTKYGIARLWDSDEINSWLQNRRGAVLRVRR